MRTRYDLQSLRGHTAHIRTVTERITVSGGEFLRDALESFDEFVASLESAPPTLVRNVRLLLSCRFFNHVYSALLLSEAGLIVDSIVCERTALETLAAFRLVMVRPSYAERYECGDFPRPAAVRKLLMKYGAAADHEHLRDLYSSGSEMAHVTRQHERFNMQWKSGDTGRLSFGGKVCVADHAEMLSFLGTAIFWFMGGLGTSHSVRHSV